MARFGQIIVGGGKIFGNWVNGGSGFYSRCAAAPAVQSGQKQSPGPGLAYPPLLLRTFTRAEQSPRIMVVRALPTDCPLLTDGRGTRGPQPSSSSQASAPQASLTNKGQAINLTTGSPTANASCWSGKNICLSAASLQMTLLMFSM